MLLFYVKISLVFFVLMIRRPPRSTQSRSSAASDVYKRQRRDRAGSPSSRRGRRRHPRPSLSLIHISEPTRLGMISYAVFCLKKKKGKLDVRGVAARLYLINIYEVTRLGMISYAVF